MNQNLVLRLAAPDRHQQGLDNDVPVKARLHGPADNLPRVEIHHHGQIEEPAPGPDVRDVRDPDLIRMIDRELALQNVRGQQGGLALHVTRLLVATDRLDPALTHDPRNAVPAAGLAVFPQILEDPRATIGTTAGLVELFDQWQKAGVLNGPVGLGLLQPRVVTAAMNPKNAAHHRDPVLVTMRADERVLYSGSFAKYARHFLRCLVLPAGGAARPSASGSRAWSRRVHRPRLWPAWPSGPRYIASGWTRPNAGYFLHRVATLGHLPHRFVWKLLGISLVAHRLLL